MSAHLLSDLVWLFYKLLTRTSIRNILKAERPVSSHGLEIGPCESSSFQCHHESECSEIKNETEVQITMQHGCPSSGVVWRAEFSRWLPMALL